MWPKADLSALQVHAAGHQLAWPQLRPLSLLQSESTLMSLARQSPAGSVAVEPVQSGATESGAAGSVPRLDSTSAADPCNLDDPRGTRCAVLLKAVLSSSMTGKMKKLNEQPGAAVHPLLSALPATPEDVLRALMRLLVRLEPTLMVPQ